MDQQAISTNFSFLSEHDGLFIELALAAENAFYSDPNTTSIKLRQLGEALAQHLAVLTGVEFDEQTTQADLLYKINRQLRLEPVVRELFRTLRVEGNEDYLDSFNRFIKEQLNQSAALAVVVNKPRDLSREQLKEIKLLLDGAGYSEAKLQTAVRNQTNQDIAASIIGHIRRAALGEPLIPFEQRVAQAMQGIYQQHNWNPNQRSWLERLAKQLVHEVIIDRDFVNNRFGEQGGAKRLDKILGEQLDEVLDQLGSAIWPPAS